MTGVYAFERSNTGPSDVCIAELMIREWGVMTFSFPPVRTGLDIDLSFYICIYIAQFGQHTKLRFTDLPQIRNPLIRPSQTSLLKHPNP